MFILLLSSPRCSIVDYSKSESLSAASMSVVWLFFLAFLAATSACTAKCNCLFLPLSFVKIRKVPSSTLRVWLLGVRCGVLGSRWRKWSAGKCLMWTLVGWHFICLNVQWWAYLYSCITKYKTARNELRLCCPPVSRLKGLLRDEKKTRSTMKHLSTIIYTHTSRVWVSDSCLSLAQLKPHHTYQTTKKILHKQYLNMWPTVV